MAIEQFLDAFGVIQVVSPTNPLPTTGAGGGGTIPPDVQASGSLGALNATLAITPGPRDTLVAAIGGTFVGTMTLQGSLDGTTWFNINGPQTWFNVSTGASAATVSSGGLWQSTISAIPLARLVMTSYTSGTAVVVLDATDGNAMVALDGPIPAGGNNIGVTSLAQAAESGSLAALNAVVGGVSDLGSFGQVQLGISGTWVGTLAFEVSMDGSTWYPKTLVSQDLSNRSNSTQTNSIGYFGHIGARYFRVRMSAYTSGTAVIVNRYNAAAGEMPVLNTARANANADGVAATNIDEVALGALNSGGTIDRLLVGSGVTSGARSLAIATGVLPLASISAAATPTAGVTLDNTTGRPQHTLQVDVTTTAVGTAGAHSIVLEASLDNVYFTTLATVAPASTSTTAADPSNHANASVAGFPYRYVRARWALIPTGWTGTLVARVVSAG